MSRLVLMSGGRCDILKSLTNVTRGTLPIPDQPLIRPTLFSLSLNAVETLLRTYLFIHPAAKVGQNIYHNKCSEGVGMLNPKSSICIFDGIE